MQAPPNPLVHLELHTDDLQEGTGLVVYVVVAIGVVAAGVWGSWLSARESGRRAPLRQAAG